MNQILKISILIVAKNWNSEIHAFSYISELKHDKIDFEVLLAVGNNPSSQRNLLAEKAEGEYILFFDDDSLPINDLLQTYHNALLTFPEAEILGGPSLLLKKNNFLFGLSDTFFSNVFGIGPIRSRYNSIGSIRKAKEKDLILCNLLMKRQFFLSTKGFNQNQYPGEENEFLKSLHLNTSIIYIPDAVVYREPRDTLYLFLGQMFSYGKGRSKHLNLNHSFEFLFLIPLIFSLYALGFPFFVNSHTVLYIPMIVHLFISMLIFTSEKGRLLSFGQKALLPFFFFLGHFSYGMGLLVGVGKYKIGKYFFRTPEKKEKIELHKLKNFKKIYI